MNDVKQIAGDGYREYTNRKYLITGISIQEKAAGSHIAYDTTHSAFIFTLSGTAVISFDSHTLLTNAQKVVHGAPGHRLSFDVTPGEAYRHLNIYYDAETPWLGGSDWMRSIYTLTLPQSEETVRILSELIRNVESANWDDFTQRNLLAGQLMMCLFGKTSINQEIARLSRAAQRMQTEYARPLRLADLARDAGMTEAHFSYAFHKIYRIRPIDYLIRQRLRKAAQMLSEGANVTEAATGAGYTDALYFSRLFKKHYGIQPSALRRRGEEEKHAEEDIQK